MTYPNTQPNPTDLVTTDSLKDAGSAGHGALHNEINAEIKGIGGELGLIPKSIDDTVAAAATPSSVANFLDMIANAVKALKGTSTWYGAAAATIAAIWAKFNATTGHAHTAAADDAPKLDHGASLTGLTDDDHTQYRLESVDHTHQSTGAEAGKLDHGLALDGLTDDDHTQYRLESVDHSHQSTGLQGGKLDHGLALDGLTDDDHTIYVKKADYGWEAAGETWTFVSIDGTMGVVNVNADVTVKYSPGMKVRYVQTTTKYGIIMVVGAYAAGVTPITFWGGTDYTLANAAITSPYYSTQKAPQGFPLNPTKWQVEVYDDTGGTQNNPVTSTVYNPVSALNIVIPIGLWQITFWYPLTCSKNVSNTVINVALSSSPNSILDLHLCVGWQGEAETIIRSFMTKSKTLNLTSKTTYYSVVAVDYTAGTVASIGFGSDRNCRSIVRAVCAYL